MTLGHLVVVNIFANFTSIQIKSENLSERLAFHLKIMFPNFRFWDSELQKGS